MPKAEYDSLIRRQYVSRIAFGACEHPYIAPFMYVFDGKYLYFLSTKYGRKMEYFTSSPKVSVEIEEYAPDLSAFTFVSLQGFLEEAKDPSQKKKVREQFVGMIAKNRLSPHVLRLLVTARMTPRTCWSVGAFGCLETGGCKRYCGTEKRVKPTHVYFLSHVTPREISEKLGALALLREKILNLPVDLPPDLEKSLIEIYPAIEKLKQKPS